MNKLDSCIHEAEITPLKTNVFRFHNPIWAFAPTSGKGAEITGGRFNPKGIPAFYCAFEQQTAFFEVTGGTSKKIIAPMLLCAYSVSIARVIDLSEHTELFAEDWRVSNLQGETSVGQRVASYSLDKNLFDAAIVPSYAHLHHSNLVIYKWNDASLQLYDPERRLPLLFREKYMHNEPVQKG